MFCFCESIGGLNMNMNLIDYVLDLVFRGYTLAPITMSIQNLMLGYKAKYKHCYFVK